MYKISINRQFIIFSPQKPTNFQGKIIKNASVSEVEKIVNFIKTGKLQKNYYLRNEDYKFLYKEFRKHFEFIRAAGGVVLNKKKELLAIYKYGKWDLPKGKIIRKESKNACAMREVKEECGIKSLEILHKLPSLYHVFLGPRNKWILKKTHWYKMQSSKKEKLVPFTKERIERCEWVVKEQLPDFLAHTYPSVKELIINLLY